MFDSAFIIGQEPDEIRGGYEANQAYIGDIAELNVWSYILTEEKIKSFVQCNNGGRDGDVVSWKMENFEFYETSPTLIEDDKFFCIPEEKIVFFPKKMTRSTAIEQCKAHGGHLFTPRTEEENSAFLHMVSSHMDECQDHLLGNIAWLGGIMESGSLKIFDKDQKMVSSNFTNWDTSIFDLNSNCLFLRADGTWKARTGCQWGKTCGGCAFIGTPIMTIKGDLVFPILKLSPNKA